MLHFYLPFSELIATGGFFYAIKVSTFAGQAVIFALLITSIVSWSVMFTKFKQIRTAEKNGRDFLNTLRSEQQFVEIFKKGKIWKD
jgi:biopolymer transport protein ExbB/TolQ